MQLQLPKSHSGVGAHHQVLAERIIQELFNWSRADLLHFVLHWPHMAMNRETRSPLQMIMLSTCTIIYQSVICAFHLLKSSLVRSSLITTTLLVLIHLAVQCIFLILVYKILRKFQNGL